MRIAAVAMTIRTRGGQLARFLCPAGLFPLLLAVSVFAQDAASPPPAADAPAPAVNPVNADPIHNRQLKIQKDYQRFEKLLYDLAEHVRLKDPERAEVLYRARSQSQEQRIATEMAAISELLREGKQYGNAADRQEELVARMKGVLKLLQSLDERERIAREIERVQELLKDTSKLIARQKDVHADTQRAQSADKSQSQQQKVADQAGKLADKIDEQDRERQERDGDRNSRKGDKTEGPESEKGFDMQGEKPPESDGQKPMSENQGKPQEGTPQEGSPQPSQQSPEGPPMGEPQHGQQQQGQQGQPQQGQQGQPQQGQQGEQQEQQEQQQTPGRQELEQARKAMQKAIEQLQKDVKDKAGEAQQEAITRLEQLKAELERILRQLREEEKETYLTLLEARFQNMLRRQERINTETTRLDGIPQAERPATFGDKAIGLKREQDDNALDAEKALALLKEEGSSVAFPEAIEQMRENMSLVAGRLAQADTGSTTQLVEQLIVDSLNEMILAFQKELQDQQEKKQQQGQQQQGEQADPGLVNQLAELKMIRSLQKQVNRITEQVGREAGDQATDDAHLKLIDDLSRRQERIQDATYDLSVGRNRK